MTRIIFAIYFVPIIAIGDQFIENGVDKGVLK
jgi:hypothetical protein